MEGAYELKHAQTDARYEPHMLDQGHELDKRTKS